MSEPGPVTLEQRTGLSAGDWVSVLGAGCAAAGAVFQWVQGGAGTVFVLFALIGWLFYKLRHCEQRHTAAEARSRVTEQEAREATQRCKNLETIVGLMAQQKNHEVRGYLLALAQIDRGDKLG